MNLLENILGKIFSFLCEIIKKVDKVGRVLLLPFVIIEIALYFSLWGDSILHIFLGLIPITSFLRHFINKFLIRRDYLADLDKYVTERNAKIKDKFKRFGIGLDERGNIEIEANFVMPRLRNEKAEVFDLRQALRETIQSKRSGIIIQGRAGLGKTALTHWLTRKIASPGEDSWKFLMRPLEVTYYDKKGEEKGNETRMLYPYPILVDLKIKKDFLLEFNHADAGVIIKLLENSDIKITQGQVRRAPTNGSSFQPESLQFWLDNKMVMPIFDGLDWLDTGVQTIFLDSLAIFLQSRNIPFILTTRRWEVEWHDLERVTFYEILPFDSCQIERYTKKFVAHQGVFDKEVFLRKVENAAQVRPRIMELLTEPILLAMILTNFSKSPSNDLSDNRALVYGEYLTKLFELSRIKPLNDVLSHLAFMSLSDRKDALETHRYSGHAEELKRLIGILFYKDERSGEYVFSERTFRVYYASRYLIEQLESPEIWKTAIRQGTLQPVPYEPVSRKDIDQWALDWREALAFATSHVAYQHSGEPKSADNLTTHISAMGSASDTSTLERLLKLRLSSILKENKFIYHQIAPRQEAVYQLLLEITADLKNELIRDISEVSYLLDEDSWKKLAADRQEQAKENAILQLLFNIRHPRVAKLLVDIAIEGGGRPSVDIERAFQNLGGLASIALEKAYYEDTSDEKRITIILQLFAYADCFREIEKIVENILFGKQSIGNPAYIRAALMIASRWDRRGTRLLFDALRKYDKLAPEVQSEQETFVEAHRVADLSPLAEAMLNFLKTSDSIVQKDIVTKIVQRKIQTRQKDVEELLALIRIQYNDFKPRTFSRFILGKLERNWSLRYKSGLLHNLNKWLFDNLRLKKSPSPVLVTSMVKIAAEADIENSQGWITKALQDRWNVASQDAINAFVTRSMKDENPLKWLNSIRGDIPKTVAKAIEDEIQKKTKKVQPVNENGD